MTKGTQKISEERSRQINEEGYSPEYDLSHISELLAAANCYSDYAQSQLKFGKEYAMAELSFAPTTWPWQRDEYKPVDDIKRNIEKAGALMAAAWDAVNNKENGMIPELDHDEDEGTPPE